MKSKYLILLVLLFLMSPVWSQHSIHLKIISADSLNPIAGANVTLGKLFSSTNATGEADFVGLKSGVYSLQISHFAFQKISKDIKLDSSIKLEIKLSSETFNLEELVISATRNSAAVSDVPSRIFTISTATLSQIPAQTADEYLVAIPGVNISRQFGIFSTKSTVSMRGVSGNEQARVLVMEDGIPLNKSDGGSVNWNLINTEAIDRIEVVKGPGSSLYGGNAMGGSINIISKTPSKPIEGSLNLNYGTYNTRQLKTNLGGLIHARKDLDVFWELNGFKRMSDGYITQSESDQKANPYIVASTLNDWAIGGRIGVLLNNNQKIEVSLVRFDDMRGTGEVVFQENGNTTEYDSWFSKVKYSGTYNKINWNVGLFFYTEDYKKVNEYLKDDYTFYKVLSVRQDKGITSSMTYDYSKKHKITTGFDLKEGSVDASDVYYTSTDIVNNAGKIRNIGLFLQDEYKFFNEKVKVVAGIRYDYAHFYDGLFTIENPTAETSFMTKYNIENRNSNPWQAWSPRLAAYYKFGLNSRVFVSWSRGFRASVLDDLCRSGRVKGGFKVANPSLTPEYLTTYEIGAEKSFSKALEAKASLYYNVGADYHYYVNSGDSIDMGFGLRPIFIRQNIEKTSTMGFETEISWKFLKSFKINASYAFNYAKINKYAPMAIGDTINLTNKFIVDVPLHTASLFLTWNYKNTKASILYRYNGSRYVNDLNAYDEIVLSDVYPQYSTLDISVSQLIMKYCLVGIEVQNLLDTKFYDSKGAVCPGRFITGTLGIKL